MSDQQIHGAALLLVGGASLIVSFSIAWALARASRARRVESAWVVTVVSFVFFAVGVVLCWFGVSVIMEG